MEIQFLGHSCFRIKGKKAILITDPFNPENVGLKFPKTTADIITISHNHGDHNNFLAIGTGTNRPEPFVVNGPGEYEISGVSILGIPSFHDDSSGSQRGKNTIYAINIDDISLVHLGDLGHKLTDEQVGEINGTDILFVPVGGIYTLDAAKAVEVVAQVEPKIVIPMHYRLPGLTFELAPVEKFLKQMMAEEIKPLDKLFILKDKLPEEKQVVVLNARD